MERGNCPTELELVDFLAGELAREHRDSVQAHVRGCILCEGKVAKLSEQGMLEATRQIVPAAGDASIRTEKQQVPSPRTTGKNAPAKKPKSDWTQQASNPSDTRTRPKDSAIRAGGAPSEIGSVPADSDQAIVAGAPVYPFLQKAIEQDEMGRIGNYRVLKLLGRGGMALVFEAEDVDLRRRVALKVMHPNLEFDPDASARFTREARVMAAFKHPHLATIYQTGRQGSSAYIAMELLQGQSLDEWLRKRQSIELPEVLRLAKEITQGLAFLHDNGLVHRDIKPSNIWIDAASQSVKILDLGLTRAVTEETNLTQSGMVMGTPGYMSPEQARGDPVNEKSDLFSLGCVLYLLATGKQPFRGPTAMAILTALAVDMPLAAQEANPNVPPALSQLIAKLLAKNPRKRPPSARYVLDILEKMERSGHVKEAIAPVNERVPRAKADSRKRRSDTRSRKERSIAKDGNGRRWGMILAAALVGAFVLGAIAFFLWPRGAPPGETAVFLSDLKPIRQDHWPITLPEKGRTKKEKGPPKKGPAVGPPPVVVEGKPSPHGIFMHPPLPPDEAEAASITYRLANEYRSFKARVAINDDGGPSESDVTFFVFGDENLLWKSRPVRRAGDIQTVEVPLTGMNQLRIAVRAAGDVRGAHAVWVEPAVWKTKVVGER